ncbi:hypothetical protein HHI36_011659 [Cryptolaemus montrouzieri]|uniref:Uncharacterized protein n=1 Tax=Cryptolaemus montrouzieri TaxID=559131 RepID=A0ABD2MMN3_9CUCU
MPVVTYLAGYCSYKVIRKIKCDFCKSKLVFDEEMVVEESYNLIKNLSRGGLSFPHDIVVGLVLVNYVLYKKLIKNFEAEFLKLNFKKDFVFNYWTNEIENNRLPACETHSPEYIFKLIIIGTTITLLKNYCGKINDKLGKNKRKKMDTVSNK